MAATKTKFCTTSIRLSEAEKRELRIAAAKGGRSGVSAEIRFRLFPPQGSK